MHEIVLTEKFLKMLKNLLNSRPCGRIMRHTTFTTFRHYKTSANKLFGQSAAVPSLVSSDELISSSLSSLDQSPKSSFTISELISHYRQCGHYLSDLDPLGLQQPSCHAYTRPLRQSINQLKHLLQSSKTSDLERLQQELNSQPGYQNVRLEQLLVRLDSIYCSSVGVEFGHLNDHTEREWATQHWESLQQNLRQNSQQRQQTARLMLQCEAFDEFLALRFPSVKRYGCEGAETMLVFFEQLFRSVQAIKSTEHSTELVIGMPHRGRLNFLVLLLQMPEQMVFQKVLGKPEFDLQSHSHLSGDVLSHLFTSVDLSLPSTSSEHVSAQTDAKSIHVSLLPNPSHLEAICPAVNGKVRAKLLDNKTGPYSPVDRPSSAQHVIPIQIHG